MRSISLFVLLLVLISACKKDQPIPEIEPETVIETVDTIPEYWSIDGVIKVGLAFDEQMRLISSKRYLNHDRAYELGHCDQIVNFEYLPNGRIKRADWGSDGHLAFDGNYFYSGNRLDSIVGAYPDDREKTVYKIVEDTSSPCKLQSYQLIDFRDDSLIYSISYYFEYLNNNCDHIATKYSNGNFSTKKRIKYSDKRRFGSSPVKSLFFKNAYPEFSKYYVLESCNLEEDGSIINCSTNEFDDLEFNEHNFVTRWSTLNYTYR